MKLVKFLKEPLIKYLRQAKLSSHSFEKIQMGHLKFMRLDHKCVRCHFSTKNKLLESDVNKQSKNIYSISPSPLSLKCCVMSLRYMRKFHVLFNFFPFFWLALVV